MKYKCTIIMFSLFSMVSCNYIKERNADIRTREYRNSCSDCEDKIAKESFEKIVKDSIILIPSTYFIGNQGDGKTCVLDFSFTPVKSSQYEGTMYITIGKGLKKAVLKTGQFVIDNYIIKSVHSYYHKYQNGYCKDVYDNKNRPVRAIPQMSEGDRSIWIIKTDKGHIIIREQEGVYHFKVLSGHKIYHNYSTHSYFFFGEEGLYTSYYDEENNAILEFAIKNHIPIETRIKFGVGFGNDIF